MKGQLNEQESPVLSIIIKKISEQLEKTKRDSYQNILRQKLIPAEGNIKSHIAKKRISTWSAKHRELQITFCLLL